MQVVLVMFKSDGERRSFSIARDVTLIGRREDCDLRIPLGDISRKHCRLIKEADTLRVEDLGSSNGTYVNNQRIQEAVISPGDGLRVGPVWFIVQIDGKPADDQIQAPAAGAQVEPEVSDRGAAEELNPTVISEVGAGNGAGQAFDPMSTLNASEPESDNDFVIQEDSAGGDQSAIIDLDELQAEAESEIDERK